MSEFKWLFIAMGVMFASMFVCLSFNEYFASKKFEACIQATKDINGCGKIK